ncbi:MAG: class I SAM-dependent methyltransferase, partial [Fidelibacterota bacterium]
EILDVSCGTGKMAIYFGKVGMTVYGFDKSLNMVKEARLIKTHDNALYHFWQGDMEYFNLKRKFHVIINLYDSIQYILTCSSMETHFNSIRDALSDGGIYIFDIVTEQGALKNFKNYYESAVQPNFRYVRKSRYDIRKRMQINDFKIWLREGGKIRKYREIHRQKIYNQEELSQIIDRSKLKVINIFDGFTFNSPGKNAERIHFVLTGD